jgi:hypothetical protein
MLAEIILVTVPQKLLLSQHEISPNIKEIKVEVLNTI